MRATHANAIPAAEATAATIATAVIAATTDLS